MFKTTAQYLKKNGVKNLLQTSLCLFMACTSTPVPKSTSVNATVILPVESKAIPNEFIRPGVYADKYKLRLYVGLSPLTPVSNWQHWACDQAVQLWWSQVYPQIPQLQKIVQEINRSADLSEVIVDQWYSKLQANIDAELKSFICSSSLQMSPYTVAFSFDNKALQALLEDHFNKKVKQHKETPKKATADLKWKNKIARVFDQIWLLQQTQQVGTSKTKQEELTLPAELKIALKKLLEPQHIPTLYFTGLDLAFLKKDKKGLNQTWHIEATKNLKKADFKIKTECQPTAPLIFGSTVKLAKAVFKLFLSRKASERSLFEYKTFVTNIDSKLLSQECTQVTQHFVQANLGRLIWSQ